MVLAAADVRVDATDAIQQTALHKAALNAGMADVQTLLDGGASPRVMDGRGYTPVHMAAKSTSLPHMHYMDSVLIGEY